MNANLKTALLKTLAFHETWGHAPTQPEWVATLSDCHSRDRASRQAGGGNPAHSEVMREIAELEADGTVVLRFGRYAFPAPTLIDAIRHNELYAPRKRRVARRVASWLSHLSSVRFVALCNTTALGHARDEGDLDFFVVTRARTIMQTRGLAVLPLKLLGKRPGTGEGRDAVCLSYFVSDDGLDLGSHMLEPDDPYFRYWFLSLLPLYDDGVSRELWSANGRITSRHPFATPWMVPPDLRVSRPRWRIPVFPALENPATGLQIRAFPPAIRDLMNHDSRVMVNDKVLKFHVDDGREEYREKYLAACKNRGLTL